MKQHSVFGNGVTRTAVLDLQLTEQACLLQVLVSDTIQTHYKFVPAARACCMLFTQGKTF